MQSIAYDFVFDEGDNLLIVEIRYGYSAEAYDLCSGFWISDFVWHKVSPNSEEWVIDEMLKNN